jgi:DNA replication protein DnaC
LKRFKNVAHFETFNDPKLERLFDVARDFAASINYTTPYWLTLCGKSGVGKTHLAKAVYRQFMQQNRFDIMFDSIRQKTYGNTGEFVNWRDFCDAVRSGAYDHIDQLCDEWFVILDDIGSERDPTGFIASALDRILNSRQKKWTLITTNLSLPEISERLDARIASRMLRDNGVVIETDATDFSLR